MIVSPKYCRKKHNFTNYESCQVDCDVDCRLSSWSEWSSCSETCGFGSKKTRTRKILVKPKKYGRQCPSKKDLVEENPCKLVSCFRFSWSTGDWSDCSAGYGQCGQGIRRRTVFCKRSDGKKVDQGCKQSRPKVEESCYIPCSGDCIITKWSSWGPCFLDCKTSKGVRYRSRSVVRRATNGARCSEDLLQTEYVNFIS